MPREVNPCLDCGAYDPDMGCTMPGPDMWYACPIESEKEENQKLLEEYAAWVDEQRKEKENNERV
jgi:hypothetical protein